MRVKRREAGKAALGFAILTTAVLCGVADWAGWMPEFPFSEAFWTYTLSSIAIVWGTYTLVSVSYDKGEIATKLRKMFDVAKDKE